MTDKQENSKRRKLVFAVMPGALACSFSAIFVNIALPLMSQQLGINGANIHWLITVFVAFATLSMLVAPKFVSLFGLRHTFLTFLILFIGASLLGGILNTFWPIILCRAIQGTSMGAIFVLAMVALFEAYPIEQRGRAGAIFGLGIAMGPTLGPTLSGIFVEFWGWRSIFFAPLPLALGSLILCWRVLPHKIINTSTPKPFDKIGFILITLTLFWLLGGSSYLQQQQWPTTATIAFVTVLVLLTVALWHYEKHCKHPLFVFGLFKYRAFNAAAIVAFVYGMGLWGSAYILPLFLQNALHMSPLKTGFVMLPSGLVLCMMLPFGGKITDNYPAHWVVILGLLCFAASFLLMGIGIAGTSFALLALFIAISRGLGLSIMTPGLDATATRALPKEDMVDGLAMINFVRQLGGALSPSLLMLLLQWRLGANSIAGAASIPVLISYKQTLMGLGLLFFLSTFAAWHMRKPKPIGL